MQQAKITVSSEIRQGEETIGTEEILFGSYTERNGWSYVRYEETETSGMAGSITTLKWNSVRIILLRRGPYTLRQEFEQGGICIGEYKTPYLTIPLETRTQSVRICEVDGSWELDLAYVLVYGSGEKSRVRLKVTVEQVPQSLDGLLTPCG